MGIFSSFFESLRPSSKKLPDITISAEGAFRNIEDVFDDVAYQIISDITPFNDDEKKDILRLMRNYIKHMNDETFNVLWSKYFLNRVWEWNEYEFWRTIALTKGAPFGFKNEKDAYKIKSPSDIFDFFSIQKVKAFLLTCGYEPPKKNIKKWSESTLSDHPELFESIKMQCIEKQKKHELYVMSQTARLRSDSLEILKMSSKKELSNVYENDKQFIDIALNRNPKAIPPFWPGSIITYKLHLKM